MFLYALLSALNDIISRSQKGEGLTRRDLAVLRLFDGLSGTAFAGLAGLYLQYAPHNPLLDLLAGSLGTGLVGAFLRWRNSPDGQLVLDDGTGNDPPTGSPIENTTASPPSTPTPPTAPLGTSVSFQNAAAGLRVYVDAAKRDPNATQTMAIPTQTPLASPNATAPTTPPTPTVSSPDAFLL